MNLPQKVGHFYPTPSVSFNTTGTSPVGVTSFLLPNEAENVSIGIDIGYTLFKRWAGATQPTHRLKEVIPIPIIIPYKPQYFKQGD